MKKLTVLAALMLLVSLSTVFAVRTHQRNLSQLTAQNIEALSNKEGRDDKLAQQAAQSEIRKNENMYERHKTTDPLDCTIYRKIEAGTAIGTGKVVEINGETLLQIDSHEIMCTSDNESVCLRQPCGGI